jgi:hypothetical protein
MKVMAVQRLAREFRNVVLEIEWEKKPDHSLRWAHHMLANPRRLI